MCVCVSVCACVCWCVYIHDYTIYSLTTECEYTTLFFTFGVEWRVCEVRLVCHWSTLPRSAIKSTLILLPLLGVTWIIGVLAVNINTIVFAALFIIFNAFQVINSSINLGVCIIYSDLLTGCLYTSPSRAQK